MGHLTAMDIAVLTLVGGGALLGFMRGLVQELLSLLAWVLAIFAVRFLHEPATAWLSNHVGTAGGAAMLAFVLLFGGMFFAGKFIAARFGKASRSSLVGGFDRGLGAGFGALKGLLIASFAFMAITLLYDIGYGNAERPEWMRDSRTYPALSATGGAISKVIDERRAEAKAARAREEARGE